MSGCAKDSGSEIDKVSGALGKNDSREDGNDLYI
jgi:hypothetical protein